MIIFIIIGFIISLCCIGNSDEYKEKKRREEEERKEKEETHIEEFKNRYDTIISNYYKNKNQFNKDINEYLYEIKEFTKYKYLFKTIKNKIFHTTLKEDDIFLAIFKMRCLHLIISNRYYKINNKNDLDSGPYKLYLYLDKSYNKLYNDNDNNFNSINKIEKYIRNGGPLNYQCIVVLSNFITIYRTYTNIKLIIFNIKCCYIMLDNGYDIYGKRLINNFQFF